MKSSQLFSHELYVFSSLFDVKVSGGVTGLGLLIQITRLTLINSILNVNIHYVNIWLSRKSYHTYEYSEQRYHLSPDFLALIFHGL